MRIRLIADDPKGYGAYKGVETSDSLFIYVHALTSVGMEASNALDEK